MTSEDLTIEDLTAEERDHLRAWREVANRSGIIDFTLISAREAKAYIAAREELVYDILETGLAAEKDGYTAMFEHECKYFDYITHADVISALEMACKLYSDELQTK